MSKEKIKKPIQQVEPGSGVSKPVKKEKVVDKKDKGVALSYDTGTKPIKAFWRKKKKKKEDGDNYSESGLV